MFRVCLFTLRSSVLLLLLVVVVLTQICLLQVSLVPCELSMRSGTVNLLIVMVTEVPPCNNICLHQNLFI